MNGISDVFTGFSSDYGGFSSLLGDLISCIPTSILLFVFGVIFIGLVLAVLRCILGLL